MYKDIFRQIPKRQASPKTARVDEVPFATIAAASGGTKILGSNHGYNQLVLGTKHFFGGLLFEVWTHGKNYTSSYYRCGDRIFIQPDEPIFINVLDLGNNAQLFGSGSYLSPYAKLGFIAFWVDNPIAEMLKRRYEPGDEVLFKFYDLEIDGGNEDSSVSSFEMLSASADDIMSHVLGLPLYLDITISGGVGEIGQATLNSPMVLILGLSSAARHGQSQLEYIPFPGSSGAVRIIYPLIGYENALLTNPQKVMTVCNTEATYDGRVGKMSVSMRVGDKPFSIQPNQRVFHHSATLDNTPDVKQYYSYFLQSMLAPGGLNNTYSTIQPYMTNKAVDGGNLTLLLRSGLISDYTSPAATYATTATVTSTAAAGASDHTARSVYNSIITSTLHYGTTGPTIDSDFTLSLKDLS